MTELDAMPPPTAPLGAEKAITMALRLAHAENALRTLSSGQVDAIVDPDGKTYLLRPAQEHLRQNERRLRQLLASNPDVLTVVNGAGMILSQDGAVTRVLGYQAGELIGRNFFLLVHSTDLPEVHSVFVKVREGLLKSAVVAFRHRLDDGFFRPVEATVARSGEAEADSLVMSLRPAGSRIEGVRHASALAKGSFVARGGLEGRQSESAVSAPTAAAQMESFIQDLFPILDCLERAVALGQTGVAEPLQEGLRMAMRGFRQLLQSQGVESLVEAGQPFDPQRHEAVAVGDDPARPAQTVLEVVETGYRRGDRILRQARVIVNEPGSAAS